MKFTIITHVEHIKHQNNYFGYAPYIREMNIWLKYVNEVTIVAPLVTAALNPIHEQYFHNTIHFRPVKEFNITKMIVAASGTNTLELSRSCIDEKIRFL